MAEAWFAEIELAVQEGERSPGTGRAYRDRLDNQILPAIGNLRLGEVTISRVDRVLKATREHHGASVAKVTRTVLSGVLGLAARHDAVASNLVRDAAPIRSATKEAHALSLAAVWDLRAKLAADQQAVDWDLVDLV